MTDRLRVVIADASHLIYSDDYRDGWAWGFRNIGCEVAIVNIESLAKLPHFVGNHGPYSTTYSGRMSKMLAQQIVAMKPNLIFCHHGRAAAHAEFLNYLRRSGAKTAVYLCDEPYECGETARYSPLYDVVFSMDPCTLNLHREARSGKPDVYYLPPAVNTERFKPRKDKQRNIPALFLGNASLDPRPEYLKQIENIIPGAKIMYWEATGKGHKQWVSLEKHADLYGSCKIGLNVHRNPAINEECFRKRIRDKSKLEYPRGLVPCQIAPDRWGTGFWNDANLPAAHINPRFFEMAACGACVINDDHRPELARLFPYVPRAATPEKFLELALYYLDHQDEAYNLGQECSAQISKRHTYRHRAAEVLMRVGLKGYTVDNLSSLLGEPQEWLSIQDFDELGISSSWAQTGAYAPFVPPSGKLSTSLSGGAKLPAFPVGPLPWLS